MNPACPQCAGPAPLDDLSRRAFLARFGMGLGSVALGDLLNPARAFAAAPPMDCGVLGSPQLAPKAKRVIYLFMSGGPSQMETFDYKPVLNQREGEALPDSVRQGQALGATANQNILALKGSDFAFAQHGQSGAWVSELLPHTAKIADELCIMRSLYTDSMNHDPALTQMQTGSQLSGRPSIGAWLSYGLGSDNANLPSFVVLITKGMRDQPIFARLWGNAFLPARHQGVQFRAGRDPVLYLGNPEGVDPEGRRLLLDRMRELHEHQRENTGDASLDARVEQYEMAYRMQTSVPDVADLSGEPDYIFDEYGPDSRTPGTFAANCLLARRLAERGVKFIQLYHRGWDQHIDLPELIKIQCKETDQPAAALVMDLKRRGMLEDTLIVWGGEFGRTSFAQKPITADNDRNSNTVGNYGRDHHPRYFSMWMAGGGAKPGHIHGETDDFSYNIARDPVHVHDFHATMLAMLGIDHEQLTYKFQGRRFRLTDVHGKVVRALMA